MTVFLTVPANITQKSTVKTPLNDRQIKKRQITMQAVQAARFRGPYLPIKPNGGKYWRFNFRFNGRRHTLAIGAHPGVGLAEAREKYPQARHLLMDGTNPVAAKQEAKAERAAALRNTLAYIAREWHAKQLPRWKPKHAARVLHYFETDVFPVISEEPIRNLRVKNIQAVIDKIANRGAIETAEKIRQWISSIFNYAAMLEQADSNPTAPLAGYLQIPETANMPALPREELREFYRRLLLADVTTAKPHCPAANSAVLCPQYRNQRRGMGRN